MIALLLTGPDCFSITRIKATGGHLHNPEDDSALVYVLDEFVGPESAYTTFESSCFDNTDMLYRRAKLSWSIVVMSKSLWACLKYLDHVCQAIFDTHA